MRSQISVSLKDVYTYLKVKLQNVKKGFYFSLHFVYFVEHFVAAVI